MGLALMGLALMGLALMGLALIGISSHGKLSYKRRFNFYRSYQARLTGCEAIARNLHECWKTHVKLCFHNYINVLSFDLADTQIVICPLKLEFSRGVTHRLKLLQQLVL